MEYGYKPTTNGRALITKCMALEKPLVLTRVAFGSGLVDEGVNLADVHALVCHVADGAIGERSHKNDRFYFTVQYATNTHPDVPMFYLSEFIVFAQDPETGEDIDMLYATLGDYKQPVPAYSPSLPPSVWDFPVILVVSDEVKVNVSAPAGLVTYEELQAAVETACKDLVNTLPTGGIKKSIDFVVSAADWMEDTNKVNGYGYYYDLADTDITAYLIPNVVITETAQETAKLAGMSTTATTYARYVRLKCVTRPTAEIVGTCHLLGRGVTSGEPGTIGDLPVATADTLGGVKIQPNSGLIIDTEGNLAVDTASDTDTSDVIDDVFDDADAEGTETTSE